MLGGLARFTRHAARAGRRRVPRLHAVGRGRDARYGVRRRRRGVRRSARRCRERHGRRDRPRAARCDAGRRREERRKSCSPPTARSARAAPWPADDWGTWRDDTDAKVDVDAAVDAHGDAMATLEPAAVDGYARSASVVPIRPRRSRRPPPRAPTRTTPAAYKAALARRCRDDRCVVLARRSRLEALTWAYASHAQLATDLYVRHPEGVEAKWQVVAPRVDAAVLWPKRYEVTAVAYLEPLRTQYYVHHPRGRAHARARRHRGAGVLRAGRAARVDPATCAARSKARSGSRRR